MRFQLSRTGVSSDSLRSAEYKRQNEAETLEAATIVWTAGNALHPLIKGPFLKRTAIAGHLGHPTCYLIFQTFLRVEMRR